MQRSKTLRLIGAAAALALVAGACSNGESNEEETPDGEQTTADDSTTDDSTDGSTEAAYDWSDPLRRRAVSMAIDREAITEAIFNGAREPADDFWPSTLQGYRGGDYCANLQYNPEEAASLWEEAGGNQGPVTFWFNSGAGHEEWIEAVANQLQENLGIEEVAFESLEFADYLDALDAAEVDGPFRLGWLMDYPSPGNFLAPLHATRGSSNSTGYTNEQFDQAVQAGEAAESLEEAVPHYQEAADILCEDVPIAPMFFGLLQGVHSENVDNVSFNAFESLEVTEVTDLDGDGQVSMYVCEPQNGLFGQMTNETCGSEVVSALFTGLTSYDKETGEVNMEVAESIESEDNQNWTITLEDGWTFHDGTPVTAQSFADAWNWAALGANGAQNNYFMGIFDGFEEMNPEEGEEAAADALSGVTVVDDHTLEVTTAEPFAQLPLALVYNAYTPLPEAFFEDPEGFGEQPIGNGPFQMDGAWEHDVQIATTAFEDYAGDQPQVDSVLYRIYSDIATAYNDVRSGALDIVDQVPTPEIPGAPEEFGDRYFEQTTSSFNYLGFPIDLELVAEWNS